ncbi:MAG: DUF4956 domain-containing protein [Oscillospiraceae bacterium]|nr:DUF4956 domain-containing protein [Oscillospiraceae bacterium]
MFESIITQGITAQSALILTAVSIALGALAAAVYRVTNRRYSKNLMVTLVVLPALVQAVIMLVNGSVGAGIAVMGAFNLVRFRSAPGSARDICCIFYAVGIGLATGMGYIAFAVVYAVIIGAVLAALSFIPAFGTTRSAKLLRVLIPENLDYTDCFKDIFDEYLTNVSMLQAKTTNMGTMYDLRYEVVLRDPLKEKELLDRIRTRNGNLTVSCGLLPENQEQL